MAIRFFGSAMLVANAAAPPSAPGLSATFANPGASAGMSFPSSATLPTLFIREEKVSDARGRMYSCSTCASSAPVAGRIVGWPGWMSLRLASVLTQSISSGVRFWFAMTRPTCVDQSGPPAASTSLSGMDAHLPYPMPVLGVAGVADAFA